MKRDIQGRRILLTGATGGIGKAIATQLAREGGRLLITGRSEAALHELAKTMPNSVAVAADVTSVDDRRRLLDECQSRLGGLDILINNAGVGSWAHFADSTEAILRQIMEVNYFAPAELMRSAIPMLTRGTQPAMVNVSSMCGRRAMPAWPEYSASKYALCGLTEALRGEMARFDIDVLLIVPGLTKTDLPQHLLKSEGRFKIDFSQGMPPDDVAAGIIRSLRGNVTETVLGSDAKRMLRFNKFFPRLLDYLIARKVTKLYQTTSS